MMGDSDLVTHVEGEVHDTDTEQWGELYAWFYICWSSSTEAPQYLHKQADENHRGMEYFCRCQSSLLQNKVIQT